MNIHNLKSHHKDQLLDFFFYYLPMDMREKLMAELPQAYNAACGSEIVKVINVARPDGWQPENLPA